MLYYGIMTLTIMHYTQMKPNQDKNDIVYTVFKRYQEKKRFEIISSNK